MKCAELRGQGGAIRFGFRSKPFPEGAILRLGAGTVFGGEACLLGHRTSGALRFGGGQAGLPFGSKSL
ncbi:hypothetical protein [Dankookia sp. P2]|uniref:hypothetical protein n=1 Tax=Dankookia sp. P2 TaxID=3423955 RepID=UPI003D666488